MKPGSSSAWSVVAALIFAVGFAACGPETKPVIESRRTTCTLHCESYVDRSCTDLSSGSKSFTTKEQCVSQCTTVGGADGVFDKMWAYDPETGKDACFDELTAQVECMASLTDDAYCNRNDLPYPERPCYEEINAESDCMSAHEPKEGGA